jgi:hypothetical protein
MLEFHAELGEGGRIGRDFGLVLNLGIVLIVLDD